MHERLLHTGLQTLTDLQTQGDDANSNTETCKLQTWASLVGELLRHLEVFLRISTALFEREKAD